MAKHRGFNQLFIVSGGVNQVFELPGQTGSLHSVISTGNHPVGRFGSQVSQHMVFDHQFDNFVILIGRHLSCPFLVSSCLVSLKNIIVTHMYPWLSWLNCAIVHFNFDLPDFWALQCSRFRFVFSQFKSDSIWLCAVNFRHHQSISPIPCQQLVTSCQIVIWAKGPRSTCNFAGRRRIPSLGVQIHSIGFFHSSIFFFFGREAPGQPHLFFFLGRRRIPSSSGCHFD